MRIPFPTVKKARDEEAERDRIIKEHQLAELEKRRKAEEEAERRKKFEKEAVEKWKIEQVEKAAKEKKEKEEAEQEMRQKMRARLLASGVPENQIEAILAGKKVGPGGHPHPGHMPGGPMPGGPMLGGHMPGGHMPGHMQGLPPPPPPAPMPGYSTEITTSKTTYTRMARKHLSIEALRAKAIEYEFDTVR